MTIPSKKLVGQNARIEEGKYLDDYLEALNRFAPVEEVFGGYREGVAKGEYTPVARLIMDTLGKTECENHLVALVMAAAKSGKWSAVKRRGEYMAGLEVVVEKNFGYSVKNGNKTFLLPSALYLVYCKAQLDK